MGEEIQLMSEEDEALTALFNQANEGIIKLLTSSGGVPKPSRHRKSDGNLATKDSIGTRTKKRRTKNKVAKQARKKNR